MIKYARWKMSWGYMAAEIGPGRKLRRLVLPRATAKAALAALGPPRGAKTQVPPHWLLRAMDHYFATGRLPSALAAETRAGTDFQRRVWALAADIPPGEVRSYGWLARRMGKPGAARAVGGAMKANPLPLLVP